MASARTLLGADYVVGSESDDGKLFLPTGLPDLELSIAVSESGDTVSFFAKGLLRNNM